MPTHFSLIARRDRGLVLLLEEADGWTLPHIRHDGFYDDVHGWFHLHVQKELRRQLGLYVTALRHLAPTLCEMELHGPVTGAPAGAAWVSRSDLETLTLAVPEHRQVLSAWFAGADVGLSSSPWEQPGWFSEAATWLQEQAAHLGYTNLETVEQIKVFAFGVVLRVGTAQGYLYFKALLPTAQNEPALILELAKGWPEHVFLRSSPLIWRGAGCSCATSVARPLWTSAQPATRLSCGPTHVFRWATLTTPNGGCGWAARTKGSVHFPPY